MLEECAKELPPTKNEHVFVEALLEVEHFGKLWRACSERRAPRRANSLSPVSRGHLSSTSGAHAPKGCLLQSALGHRHKLNHDAPEQELKTTQPSCGAPCTVAEKRSPCLGSPGDAEAMNRSSFKRRPSSGSSSDQPLASPRLWEPLAHRVSQSGSLGDTGHSTEECSRNHPTFSCVSSLVTPRRASARSKTSSVSARSQWR